QIGTACHAYLAVAPWLSRDPVQGVVSVFYLKMLGQPFSCAVFPASGILDHYGIASLDKTPVDFCTAGFSIGSPDQNCRTFFPDPSGKVHICSQFFSIS